MFVQNKVALSVDFECQHLWTKMAMIMILVSKGLLGNRFLKKHLESLIGKFWSRLNWRISQTFIFLGLFLRQKYYIFLFARSWFLGTYRNLGRHSHHQYIHPYKCMYMKRPCLNSLHHQSMEGLWASNTHLWMKNIDLDITVLQNYITQVVGNGHFKNSFDTRSGMSWMSKDIRKECL